MSNHCYRFNEDKQQLSAPQLLYVTEAKYENDWHGALHTHNFMELFFVLEGKCTFQINNHTFPIRENDLLIVNPNVLHAEYGNDATPLHYIVIAVDDMQLNIDSNEEYYLHNFSHRKEEILFCFKSILREARRKETNYEIISHHLFCALMQYIDRGTGAELIPTEVSPQKTIRECRFIEQYMNEHFAEDISLQTLSDLTFLNKYYLAHAFKKYKGVSPITYLIQVRINEAKFLLESTNLPVSEIVSITGFSSQSYFSQTFKKETGMTPVAYRKKRSKQKKTL